jgi:hypothetical protein
MSQHIRKTKIITEIAHMRLVEGKSREYIKKWLEDEYSFKRAAIYSYLQEVDKLYFSDDRDIKSILSEAIAIIENKLQYITDSKVWLDYFRELNKLRGLYTKKMEINGSIENNITTIKLIEVRRDDNGDVKENRLN